MAGWCHRCDGPELGQTLGDGEGQGRLACCSPWGLKASHMTGLLNNKALKCTLLVFFSHYLEQAHVHGKLHTKPENAI